MTVYQKGSMGKAALWAVQQQKSHHQVSQQAIMSIDAVLTAVSENLDTCAIFFFCIRNRGGLT